MIQKILHLIDFSTRQHNVLCHIEGNLSVGPYHTGIIIIYLSNCSHHRT